MKFSYRYLYLTLLLVCCAVTIHGQNKEDIYTKAEQAFNYGHFHESDSILLAGIDKLKGADLVSSYRLLALSCLIQDLPDEATNYASKLLAVDPFYTAYGDTPRFSDIIEQLKKGTETVTTASQQEESLEEVPVPITLITKNMILASGARTLSELLTLYVPGLTKVGSIEDNVAYRGVYGLTQETILVMEDGHRMNSQSTNAMPMDYRINLEKVKQIEVLRGPASSLYGNVALTAVVNVITESGSSLDGAHLMLEGGKNKTYGGTFMIGRGNLRTDYMAWFSILNTQGQSVYDATDDATRYIDGYNSKPALDLGAKIRWGDFNVSVTGKHAKPVPYYNLIGVGNFNYDKYSKQMGSKPGMSRLLTRFDVDYSHRWNKFTLAASAFGSMEQLQLFNVLGDSVNYMLAYALMQMTPAGATNPHTSGLWEIFNWEDYAFGGSVSGSYAYKIPHTNMDGSIMMGVQYEGMIPSYADFKLGYNFSETSNVTSQVFEEGNEHTISAFMQLKHHLIPKKLIFNGGLRYDNRIRFNDMKIHTLSPRISLIWMLNKTLTLKGSYSHSFVDAPYLYRASQVSIFSGGSSLNPEKMDAYQLTLNFNSKPLHLSYDANVFYNKVYDLVFYNMSASSFTNAGNSTSWGIENVFQYNTGSTLLSLNLTYQHLNATTYCVPRLIGNIVASKTFWKQLSIHANMHIQSAFNYYQIRLEEILAAQMANQSYTTPLGRQGCTPIFGAGAEWRLPHKVCVGIDAYNLLNKQYVIGGQSRDGYQQQGFSFLGKVSVDF